ncbi:MAG: hypothetical protein ABJG88_10025 [Litorimonas sp.]
MEETWELGVVSSEQLILCYALVGSIVALIKPWRWFANLFLALFFKPLFSVGYSSLNDKARRRKGFIAYSILHPTVRKRGFSAAKEEVSDSKSKLDRHLSGISKFEESYPEFVSAVTEAREKRGEGFEKLRKFLFAISFFLFLYFVYLFIEWHNDRRNNQHIKTLENTEFIASNSKMIADMVAIRDMNLQLKAADELSLKELRVASESLIQKVTSLSSELEKQQEQNSNFSKKLAKDRVELQELARRNEVLGELNEEQISAIKEVLLEESRVSALIAIAVGAMVTFLLTFLGPLVNLKFKRIWKSSRFGN